MDFYKTGFSKLVTFKCYDIQFPPLIKIVPKSIISAVHLQQQTFTLSKWWKRDRYCWPCHAHSRCWRKRGLLKMPHSLSDAFAMTDFARNCTFPSISLSPLGTRLDLLGWSHPACNVLAAWSTLSDHLSFAPWSGHSEEIVSTRTESPEKARALRTALIYLMA